MSLSCDAAESHIEGVLVWMIVYSEMKLVLDEEPVVGASFAIGLSELAHVVFNAITSVLAAVVYVFAKASVDVEVRIDMLPARLAVIFAWEGYNAASCVHDERLFLSIVAHIDINVEVLQVSCVSEEGT